MIVRELKLTVNNNTATLNEPVTIYMYDRNILLRVTVEHTKFITHYINGVESWQIRKATTIIKSPDGKIYKYIDDKISGNEHKISILIPKEWTNEIKETGKYYFQIQINEDDDSRVTLPPFFITLEKSLFPYADDEFGEADSSSFDVTMAGTYPGLIDASNIKTGYYDYNVWEENTLITKEALSKIETRLGEIYLGDGIRKTEINDYDIEIENKSTVDVVNELKRLIDVTRQSLNDYIVGVQPVQEVLVREITLENSKIELDVGASEPIVYNVIPENHDEKLNWSSNNTDIAFVDQDGNVTAIGSGSTSIFCTPSKSTDKYRRVDITVNEEKVIDIDLSQSNISITGRNETYKLDYTLNTSENISVYWSSKDNTIAEVDQTGTVTCKSSGNTIIRCEVPNSNVYAECNVECIINAESIIVSPSIVPLAKGETYQLNYTISPIDAVQKNVSWKSSDPLKVTVNQNGLIRVNSDTISLATITCTVEGTSISGTCTVSISQPVYGEIDLSDSSLSLTEGGRPGYFKVKLDRQPSQEQIVNVNITGGSDNVTLNKTILTFTPSNYNTYQTVEVASIHHEEDYSNRESIIILSSDNVSSKTVNVTIVNVDEEPTPEPTVYPIQFKTLDNDNTGTFTLNGNTINVSDCVNDGDDIYKYDPGTSIETVSFAGCNITEIVKLRASDIISLSFGDCDSLERVCLDECGTNNLNSMRAMFGGCTSLIELDVANLDTSNITDMSFIFYDCSALTELDLSNWDVNNVTTIHQIVAGCTRLTSIDISNWNLEKVTNLYSAFSGCPSLTSITCNIASTIEKLYQYLPVRNARDGIIHTNATISSALEANLYDRGWFLG